MSNTPLDLVTAIANSSLPAVLFFILGCAASAWFMGYDDIVKPIPLGVGTLLSLIFIGVQTIIKKWNSLFGYWSGVSWDDGVMRPEHHELVDHNKFLWGVQISNKCIYLTGARCRKCNGSILIWENSKRRKVQFYCAAGCLRYKATFKGTKRTVFDSIKRKLISIKTESAQKKAD